MSIKISSKRTVLPSTRLSAPKNAAVRGRSGAGKAPNNKTPLQELLNSISESWSRIPREERDRIPTDGAMNIDHYLYGIPKVSE
jgi:hypothetical protein